MRVPSEQTTTLFRQLRSKGRLAGAVGSGDHDLQPGRMQDTLSRTPKAEHKRMGRSPRCANPPKKLESVRSSPDGLIRRATEQRGGPNEAREMRTDDRAQRPVIRVLVFVRE
jgi:hypothetical protein